MNNFTRTFSAGLHQLFQQKSHTSYHQHSLPHEKTKTNPLQFSSLMSTVNEYPKQTIPYKSVPANHYYLAYALTRIWWKNIILTFHAIKYNKSYVEKKQSVSLSNNDSVKIKNIGIGMEVLSSCVRKLKLKRNRKVLAEGFREIEWNLKVWKVERIGMKREVKAVFKEMRKQYRGMLEIKTRVMKSKTKIKIKPNVIPQDKLKDSTKNKDKTSRNDQRHIQSNYRKQHQHQISQFQSKRQQLISKIKMQEKKKESQKYFQDLDSKLDQLEVLIDNTKKMRQEDSQRRQRIQKMLTQQRMNRYNSQSKSKSNAKSISISKQSSKSKFKFKEISSKLNSEKTKKQQANKETKQVQQNYYASNKHPPNAYPTFQFPTTPQYYQTPYYTQPQVNVPTTVQPIVYQVVQPIYIPQHIPPPSPGFYNYMMTERTEKRQSHQNNLPSSKYIRR